MWTLPQPYWILPIWWQYIKSIHVCVNCAVWTNLDGAKDLEKYALVDKLNATAPENLAKVMKGVNGWLVQISTCYVFGKESYTTPVRKTKQVLLQASMVPQNSRESKR